MKEKEIPIFLAVFIVSVICCVIMKKIQPDTFKLYLIRVIIILIAFTSFVCALVFLG